MSFLEAKRFLDKSVYSMLNKYTNLCLKSFGLVPAGNNGNTPELYMKCKWIMTQNVVNFHCLSNNFWQFKKIQSNNFIIHTKKHLKNLGTSYYIISYITGHYTVFKVTKRELNLEIRAYIKGLVSLILAWRLYNETCQIHVASVVSFRSFFSGIDIWRW